MGRVQWKWVSMKPGATTSPVASITSLPVMFLLVMVAIRPSLMPTLATASYIVSGSMTRPLLIARSYVCAEAGAKVPKHAAKMAAALMIEFTLVLMFSSLVASSGATRRLTYGRSGLAHAADGRCGAQG